MDGIFIPGNVPSSKNSKQWTGKMLIHSKTVRRYISATKTHYINSKKVFDSRLAKLCQWKTSTIFPLHISFYFIRNSKRKFDYINPAQTVQDLMVKYNWIDDDNCDIMIPVFKGYHIDKEKPGVIINILEP
jgi:hypothetical protein